MTRFLSLCAAVVLLAFPLAAASGSSRSPIDFSADGARIQRGSSAAPLTPASNRTRAEVVRDFLTRQGRGSAASSLVTVSENATRGVTHLRMEQQVSGLTVYGTYVKAAVDADGRLLSLIDNTVGAQHVLPARIGPSEALASALAAHYADRPELAQGLTETGTSGNTTRFTTSPFWHAAPTATRVAVALQGGSLVEGFLVETWEEESNILWHTLVDDAGLVVHTELRTNTDAYNIFPDHPGNSTQTLVSGPGSGNAYSPIGWVTNDTTIGNNVDAYLDRDNNNSADSGGRPVSSTQTFNYTVNLSQEPTTSTNQMGAVTNLFYVNNVIHDKLYRHGFTESAGNFQTNNFGLGGNGNDPVNAEAQDGGGTNNANFSTPSDGSRPRMQMYLWTHSTPSRDGDLDSDIVWHEYGHGLTWRMIGGMSGGLAGAIGEGMSDTLAIYVNRNDVVGEYSYNNPGGIRRYPYTNYPLTYGDVTGSSVHSDGEIYAATMWKLLELWEGAGFTQDELYDAVVDGMNFTPSTPAYEDMRDGILASSPTAEKDCVVWKAFAQFGIGEGADGTQSCSIFRCTVSVTESFVVPSQCSDGGANTAPTVSIDSPADGASFVSGTSVTFSGTATDTEDGTLSGSIVWTSSLDGSLGSGSSVTTSTLSLGTHTVTAAASDSGGLSGSSSISVTITSEEPTAITLSASGRKVKGNHTVDLTWSGATTTSVDVFRNGAKVVTTANDGAHTDSMNNKGGGSYTYKLCEAGSTTACSNEVNVTF